MNVEYLIWAVLNKDHLDIWERQQISKILQSLIKNDVPNN